MVSIDLFPLALHEEINIMMSRLSMTNKSVGKLLTRSTSYIAIARNGRRMGPTERVHRRLATVYNKRFPRT